MSRRDSFEDDGRTVADMSGLEGTGLFGRRPHSSRTEQRNTPGSRDDDTVREQNPWEKTSFTWKERVRYMGVALGAALSIAFVLLAGIAFIIWLFTLYT